MPRLRLTRAIRRERLFLALDTLVDYPVTWISSPAGAGKTTLVATYLHARRIPALWYRVDESDSDVASFFYYLGKAAKRLKRGRAGDLPQFGPEYRLSLSVFTRHYFDSFFAGIHSPTAMVFDDSQDTPEGSAIHDVMKIVLPVLPEFVRVFVVSRTGLPPQFSVLEAESTVATMIGWRRSVSPWMR